jgi:hypothetical protein
VKKLFLVVIAALGLVTGAMQPAAAQTQSFPPRIDLPNGWQPEGITTGRGTTVYVGSLANGAIWRGDVRTGQGAVLVPGTAGAVAVGVDYDRANNRIWVAGGPTGTVTAYDASTGAKLATYTFSAGFLNDLVVTKDAVYATDSFIPQLAVVPLGPGGSLPPPSAATTLPLTGDIAYVAGQFNANGIVAARGGRTLVIGQTVTGQLFTVDPVSGATRAVDLAGATVGGADGLELRGHTLYVVQGMSNGSPLNQVSVVRLGSQLTSGKVVRVLTDPLLDIPSTAALSAGRLWVVNARFTTPPGPAVPYWITRLSTH